jgi:2-C-methyl-D-erythritol 4-phosphate cytidylyltransferase
MSNFHVIIPAAGVGNRMANVLPKQYIALAGKPLVAHVINTFFNHPMITSIHLALSPDDQFWRTLTLNPDSKLRLHYTGGASRSETVLNTLNVIEADSDDWVLVHDAARPGLTAEALTRLLSTLQDDVVGGLLALPVADTLKLSQTDNRVRSTVSRENLWRAQTPQMFRFATLHQALSQFAGTPTDESEAVEALGLQPRLVEGELRNLKVTYPQDLALLETLFAADNTKGNA